MPPALPPGKVPAAVLAALGLTAVGADCLGVLGPCLTPADTHVLPCLSPPMPDEPPPPPDPPPSLDVCLSVAPDEMIPPPPPAEGAAPGVDKEEARRKVLERGVLPPDVAEKLVRG